MTSSTLFSKTIVDNLLTISPFQEHHRAPGPGVPSFVGTDQEKENNKPPIRYQGNINMVGTIRWENDP